jgi:hypothetical protein
VWYPKAWELDDNLHISLVVVLCSPIHPDDEDPSVNLLVPSDWKGYAEFCSPSSECMQMLKEAGFAFASEHPDWYADYAVGKYVPWLESDGSFNESSLLTRLAKEAKKFVALESEITARIREVSAMFPRKKSKR